MVIGQAISQARVFLAEVGDCRDISWASSMDSRTSLCVLSRGTHSFHELFDDVGVNLHGSPKSGHPFGTHRGITINSWLKSIALK